MLIPLILVCLEAEWESMETFDGFTEAVEVKPGDVITSREWNLFSASVNERILTGFGDAVFRCVEYVLALFRAMLAPENALQFHGEGEMMETFHNMNPNAGQWPLSGVDPGSGLPEPSGPNVQNPIMAWAYGNARAGLDNESVRLGRVATALQSHTTVEKWQAAKDARGLVDVTNGVQNAPARECALEFVKLAYRRDSLFNVSYGGYLPGPPLLQEKCHTPCVTTAPDYCSSPTRDNMDVYFTALNEDVQEPSSHAYEYALDVECLSDPTKTVKQIHYAGTCLPCDDGDCTATPPVPSAACHDYCDHVLVWYELPLGWYVVRNDGLTDWLPKSQWIEGPYKNVSGLKHDIGDQIRRALNGFDREFRGADSQRTSEYNLEHAFDNQAYWTSQNYLAPNMGQLEGTVIKARYPAWRLNPGYHVSGAKLYHDSGGTSHTWGRVTVGTLTQDFVATHALVMITPSTTNKSVQVTLTHADGTIPLGTVSGEAQIVKLPDLRLCNVEVRIDGDLTLDGGEQLLVECTELQECKPEWWDHHVLLRKAGQKLVGGQGGGLADPHLDGVGTQEEASERIWSDYLSFGTVVNSGDVNSLSETTYINENAVYDAARRMYLNCRLMNRYALRDYSVEGGKSVLWFTKHPRTADAPMDDPGDMGDTSIDLWDGMTVQRVPPEDGTNDGFNSRWVLGMWLKPFSSALGSEIAPNKFGDVFPDVNRCLSDDVVSVRNESGFAQLTNRSQTETWRGSLFACAPSGWNYAQTFAQTPQNINHVGSSWLGASYTDDDRKNFARACRIYEPPIEIQSIENVDDGFETLVKVTLMRRLRNTAGQPWGAAESDIVRSGFDRNNRTVTGLDGHYYSPGGWHWNDIASEPFACEERNIRLYLFWYWASIPPNVMKPGDHAISCRQEALWGGENRMASCIPHFYFLKLLEQAKADLDTTVDFADALHDHDQPLHAEWMLRAMVEGCVAGEEALDCTTPQSAQAYDWTWRDLLARVLGRTSVGAFATETTPSLTSAQIRADAPEGFGPLPNTISAAEVFNQFARIANSMTRYRVMLPWKAQCRIKDNINYANDSLERDGKIEVVVPATGVGACGMSFCSHGDGSTFGAAYTNSGGAPANKMDVILDWADMNYNESVYAQTGAQIGGCWWVIGNDGKPTTNGNWTLQTTRRTAEMRFDLIDPDVYLEAVPEFWRGMVNMNSPQLGALFAIESVTQTYSLTGDLTCSPLTCTFRANPPTTSYRCTFVRNGVFNMDTGASPPGGVSWVYMVGGVNECNGQGPGRRDDIWLMASSTPVLEVPVVSREEWAVVPKSETEVCAPLENVR